MQVVAGPDRNPGDDDRGFREIDHDEKSVEDCKVWLIRQKQTRQWASTKATVDAIHALLSKPAHAVSLVTPDPLVRISLGGTEIKPAKVVAGPATTNIVSMPRK